MPIAASYLDEGEEVLVDLRPHWVFLAGPLALTTVAGVVALVVTAQSPHPPVGVPVVLGVMVAVPAAWLLVRIARWTATSLVLTDRRLFLSHGLLQREVAQVRLGEIVDVRCTQTLPERVIGSGTIAVGLVGGRTVTLDDVRRPRALERVLRSRVGQGEQDTAVPPPPPVPADVVGATLTPPPPAPGRAPIGPGDPTPPRGVPAVAGGAAGVAPGGGPPASESIADRLVQLDELRRRGALTSAEFEVMKSRLLDRL